MSELGHEPQLTAATDSVKPLYLFPTVSFPPPPSASPWFLFYECWHAGRVPACPLLLISVSGSWMAASFLESRGGSPLDGGTRIGPMSPAEVKNLFFRLMSSGRNGGGGRQEGSPVSEGEPLPSPVTLTAAPASMAPTVIPYRHGQGARGAAGTCRRGPALCGLMPAWERAGRE